MCVPGKHMFLCMSPHAEIIHIVRNKLSAVPQETAAFPILVNDPRSLWERRGEPLQSLGEVEKKQVQFCPGRVNAKVEEALDQAIEPLMHHHVYKWQVFTRGFSIFVERLF
jgi:hypothetical protein